VEIYEIIFGWESGSRFAMEVGDSARHWSAFYALRVIEEIKSPCAAEGVRLKLVECIYTFQNPVLGHVVKVSYVPR
jgi:hypothetical protein